MKKFGAVVASCAIVVIVSLLILLTGVPYKYGYAYFFPLAILLASLWNLYFALLIAIVSSLVFAFSLAGEQGNLWVGITGALAWLLLAFLSSVLISAFQKRIRYFSLLSDMERTMCSVLDMSRVLSLIAEKTAKALNAKGCSIRLLDQSGQTLEIKATYGLSDKYMTKGPVQVEHSKVDQEVLEGKVVYIEDASKDPRFQYPEEAQREGIVSVLSVPLRLADRKIGVLRVYTSELRRFSSEEIEFLSAVAAQAAVAIQNAALYETLKQQYKDVEDILWKSIW